MSTLASCGLQLGAVAVFPERDAKPPLAMELGVRYKPARYSGLYGAVDTLMANAPGPGRFGLREVALGAGYHWLAHDRLALEVGPRIGIGEPAFVSFKRTGLHAALDLALVLRLAGMADRNAGFLVVGPSLDLVLFGRGGVWARPYGDASDELFDAAAGVALRVNLRSDVSDLRDHDWEGP